MKLTLRAIRINNRWTVEETAKKYGVSQETIRNYENFKTYPDVPIINNIIKTTGMKYDDIIFLPHNCNLIAKKQIKESKNESGLWNRWSYDW